MSKSFQFALFTSLVLWLGLVSHGWARGFGGIPGGISPPAGGFGGQLNHVAATGHLYRNPGGVDAYDSLGAWNFVPHGLGPSPFPTPHAPAGVPSVRTPMPRYAPTAPRINSSTMLMNPAIGGLAHTGAALSRGAATSSPRLTMPSASMRRPYSLPSDAGLHALSSFKMPK